MNKISIFSKPSKPQTLSEISRDLAQIFFASMAVAPLISDAVVNPWVVILGLFLSSICWIWSVLIVEK